MIFIFTKEKINFMAQRKLLIIVSVLFVASALFLFWQNDRELNPDRGKIWWTLSFTQPEQEESLSFTLENHSNQTDFSYEISVGKELIQKESFIAKSGEKTVVLPPSIKKQSERVKITVITGTEKKEIYR